MDYQCVNNVKLCLVNYTYLIGKITWLVVSTISTSVASVLRRNTPYMLFKAGLAYIACKASHTYTFKPGATF